MTRDLRIILKTHKYEGQFQGFFFQATEHLTVSRRAHSTGGHIDRFPALDQTDSPKERKQHAIWNGRTAGGATFCVNWMSIKHLTHTLKFSLVF